VPAQHFDDPVAAYDNLAAEYATVSQRRSRYLRSVENQIVFRIPASARSLLDVGAGDGARAMRIASAAKLATVTLLEPSSAMAGSPTGAAELWRMRAEDLNPDAIHRRFDVITCLWNVLGHVPPAGRLRAFSATARLLFDHGRMFLDINHRYNARCYGWLATCARWIKDSALRSPRTGDVTATWKVGVDRISTPGHVFRHREIISQARQSGLELLERIVIDYEDGAVRRLPWSGNLLYIFRRNSRTASASAPATS
jgi:SAM-dependent methyltransferase